MYKVGQRGDRFFRIGIKLDRGLELALGLLQVIVQPVEASQQKVIVNIVGFDLDDLFVLVDGQLEDVLRALPGLHVTQRAQINTAQQLVGFQVVGIALENVLGFEDSIPNTPGLGIELSQRRSQILGSRIGIDGQPVFLDGFIGQLAAAVHRHLLLVHMGQGVVVIRRRLVELAGRGRGRCFGIRSRSLLRGNSRDGQQENKSAINTFHREPSASPKHSDWMPDRCWRVLFIL